MKQSIKKAVQSAFKASGDMITPVVLRVKTGEVYNPSTRENVPAFDVYQIKECATGEFTRRELEDWGAQIGDRKAVCLGGFPLDVSGEIEIDGETFQVVNGRGVRDILTIYQIRK